MATLVQICINAVAQAMPLPTHPTPETIPDEALCMLLVETYMRINQARRRLGSTYSPARHLCALRQFATLWQPRVLVLTAPTAPTAPAVALCDELQAFTSSLQHLQLASPNASWLSGLQHLQHLTCLSLRGCPNLSAAALRHALQPLQQLRALDLSGLTGVTDALAATLVSLTELLVLQLDRTGVTDLTLEWLTYGQRLHAWNAATAAQQQAGHRVAAAAAIAEAPQGSSPDGPAGLQHWPRTKIRCWHLAYTRVSPRAVELLSSCEDITIVDLRGSGVKAGQLAPLRSRFALSAVQGAVLSRTTALALAAVTLEQFVCADAAEHGPLVAAVTTAASGSMAAAGPQQQQQQGGVLGQQVVNRGVAELLQAAAAVECGVAPAVHGSHVT